MQRSSADRRLRLPAARLGLAGALMLIAIACAAAGVAAVLLRPPSFTSRRDTIAYVLSRHDVAFREIYIDRRWPDTVNTISYSADLQIVLPTASRVAGRIECRDREHGCVLFVQRFGIEHEPLPDVTTSPTPLILDQLIAWGKALLAERAP